MKEGVVFATVISGAFVIILVLSFWLSASDCHGRWRGTMETEWSVFGGCRVHVDGKWWPDSRFRYLGDVQ